MARTWRGGGRPAGARARGFTLIELLIYLALVTSMAGVLVAIERGARQSSGVQSALLEMLADQDRLQARLLGDVARARSAVATASGAGLALEIEIEPGRIERVAYVVSEVDRARVLERTREGGHGSVEPGVQLMARSVADARFEVAAGAGGAAPVVTATLVLRPLLLDGTTFERRFALRAASRVGR